MLDEGVFFFRFFPCGERQAFALPREGVIPITLPGLCPAFALSYGHRYVSHAPNRLAQSYCVTMGDSREGLRTSFSMSLADMLARPIWPPLSFGDRGRAGRGWALSWMVRIAFITADRSQRLPQPRPRPRSIGITPAFFSVSSATPDVVPKSSAISSFLM